MTRQCDGVAMNAASRTKLRSARGSHLKIDANAAAESADAKFVMESKMRTKTVTALAATVAILSIPAAHAQLEPRVAPPAPSQPSNPRECPPNVGNGGPSNEITGSRTLSDQLSQSKGVICPPTGVDPGISVPPIGGGRTPVVPPPGTPGGDPSIQPKG
jgi:hypothetical protein